MVHEKRTRGRNDVEKIASASNRPACDHGNNRLLTVAISILNDLLRYLVCPARVNNCVLQHSILFTVCLHFIKLIHLN